MELLIMKFSPASHHLISQRFRGLKLPVPKYPQGVFILLRERPCLTSIKQQVECVFWSLHIYVAHGREVTAWQLADTCL